MRPPGERHRIETVLQRGYNIRVDCVGMRKKILRGTIGRGSSTDALVSVALGLASTLAPASAASAAASAAAATTSAATPTPTSSPI